MLFIIRLFLKVWNSVPNSNREQKISFEITIFWMKISITIAMTLKLKPMFEKFIFLAPIQSNCYEVLLILYIELTDILWWRQLSINFLCGFISSFFLRPDQRTTKAGNQWSDSVISSVREQSLREIEEKLKPIGFTKNSLYFYGFKLHFEYKVCIYERNSLFIISKDNVKQKGIHLIHSTIYLLY